MTVMPADGDVLNVVLIGVSDLVRRAVSRMSDLKIIKQISNMDDFMAFLEDPGAINSPLVIAGSMIEGLQAVEMAQALRGHLKDSMIFYCHDSREAGFDRELYVKNGFSDAFLLSFEKEVFHQALEEIINHFKKNPQFRSVQIIDLEDNTTLDFDLFLLLPNNQRYIRYSSAGQRIDSERVNKLKAGKVNSVFVPLEQMPKFYDYAAARLHKLSSADGTLSETERRERLRVAVRDLMTGIFSTDRDVSFESGQQMMADATEIVKSFLSQRGQSDLSLRILELMGSKGDSYSHLSNVSTLAALFSMSTGIGKPEELALAGLFHDIGLSLISREIQEKSESAMSESEREIYRKHPEFSVNLVKEKKIVLSQSVQLSIMQHHERVDGTGYPLGLMEPKLKHESQILGIADEFDKLTQFKLGQPLLSPAKAMEQIKQAGGFNPDLVNSLVAAYFR